MQLQEVKYKSTSKGNIWDYLNVIKPRETALLVFIGMITALLSGEGSLTVGQSFLIFMALLLASSGANGLTNYFDREIDSRMERTRHRALPAGRIYPPERALVVMAALSITGLILAWFLHPYAFVADLVGTVVAIIWRKRVTCVFPQGMIASCAPVLMGWFAMKPAVSWEILLLCVLIALWLPSHIWSIMIAHRNDYSQAGITYFPINCSIKLVASILFFSSLLLYAASIGLYFIGEFGLIYLVVANISGIMIVYSSFRLMASGLAGDAWKLYKLSAFPYLGLIFLVIGLDIWL